MSLLGIRRAGRSLPGRLRQLSVAELYRPKEQKSRNDVLFIVAFVRHIGPYEGLLDRDSPLFLLWDELFRWGNQNKLINADSLLIGIPQDDPSLAPPDKQRFDVCVQIPEDFATPRATLAAK